MTPEKPLLGKHYSRRRILGWGLAVASVPLLVACGRDDDQPNETQTLSPEERLERAAERMTQVETARFQLNVEGTTFVDAARSIQLLNASGDLVRPDRVRASFQARLQGTLNATIQIITVGEDTWMTDLVTGDWIVAPDEIGYNPTVLFDNETGLGPVMRALESPEVVGTEEIRGQQADHIRGMVRSDVIAPVTANTMSSPEVAIDVWLGHDTHDLLRAIVEEQLTDQNDDPATWTVNISRQNEPVAIEPPTL